MRAFAFTVGLALVACGGHDDWQPLQPPGGRFAAELPGAAVAEVRSQVTLPTMTEVHTYRVDRGPRGSFQVAYYELPMALGSGAQASADELDCTHPFEGSHFAISGKAPITIGQLTGIAITGVAPTSDSLPEGGAEELRCVIAGTRMFHLIGIGPNTDAQRADIARFMGSFRVL